MLYCRKQAPDSYKKNWTNIHKNTPNLQNIINAAASDVQMHTRITPIWEQIRQKKDLFNENTNHYWTVQNRWTSTMNGVCTTTSTQTNSLKNCSKFATRSVLK